MAARLQTMEYASRATYGNVAYDFGTANPTRTGWRDIPVEQSEEQKRRLTRSREKAAARESAERGISVSSVVGFIAVGLMMVLLLMAYVQLTEVLAETTRVQNELYELYEQKNQVKVDYENTFNLTEVEQYATGTLGMIRASDGQRFQLDVNTADKAEVLDRSSTADEDSIGRGIADFLTGVLSYF